MWADRRGPAAATTRARWYFPCKKKSNFKGGFVSEFQHMHNFETKQRANLETFCDRQLKGNLWWGLF